jgi:ABC-type sugar transport system substrate-binding protein
MKKIIAVILILILSLTLLAACGGAGSSTAKTPAGGGAAAPAAKKLVIGAAFTGVDIGFWGAVWNGFEDAAKTADVEHVLLVAEGDADKQNTQIRSMIAQKVNAIAIAPVDGSVVASAVKEAQAQGIPCVMVNRPLQSGDVVADMSVLSDNQAMAYEQLTWLAEKARADKVVYNILLLIGGLSDENAVLRREGHYAAIKENSDVLNLVVDVPTDWKAELALQGVQNSMQAYDNINCIVFPSDGQVIQIQSALEQINRWVKIGEPGHITLASFDGDSRIINVYEQGFVTCTAVQDAYGQGVRSLEYAVKLAKGEKFDNKIDLDSGILLTADKYEEMKENLWGYTVWKNLPK